MLHGVGKQRRMKGTLSSPSQIPAEERFPFGADCEHVTLLTKPWPRRTRRLPFVANRRESSRRRTQAIAMASEAENAAKKFFRAALPQFDPPRPRSISTWSATRVLGARHARHERFGYAVQSGSCIRVCTSQSDVKCYSAMSDVQSV
jgi:hypothetical protein